MYSINKKNYKFILFIFLIITLYIFLLLLLRKRNLEEFVTTTSTTATYSAGENLVWTVPVGIREATFTVIGGKGGNRTDGLYFGGFGGKVTTTINNLKDGDKYHIYVGNNGKTDGSGGADIYSIFYSNMYDNNGIIIGMGGEPDLNFNKYRGGNAVPGKGESIVTGMGGGGGSASHIFYNNSSIIIAAGGGGAGMYSNGGNGCINNISNGGDGYGGFGINNYLGGRGGWNITMSSSGEDAVGSGGGGGGGYIGGSGGFYTGGGAGSSYVIPTNSSNTNYITDTSGNPSIIIDWGVKPTSTQPTSTQPTTTQPTTTFPTSTQPTTTQPTTTFPTSTQPTTTFPTTTFPTTTFPTSTQPTTTRPITTRPITTRPTTTRPITTKYKLINSTIRFNNNQNNLNNVMSGNYMFDANLYISPMNNSLYD